MSPSTNFAPSLLSVASVRVLQRMMESDARAIQTRMKEQLSQLWTEMALFERLIYKNTSQHRHCTYFQRLRQVRRRLQLLQRSGLEEIVESFVRLLPSCNGAMKCHSTKPKNAVEELKLGKTFLWKLLGIARLLEQMDNPILAAGSQIAGILSQCFFMPFSLTMLAVLARFRALLLQLLYEVVAVFNMLSAVCQDKKAPTGTYTQLSKGYKFEWFRACNEKVPLSLRCEVDGVRHRLYEVKSHDENQEENNAIKVKPLVSTFGEDTTRIKYNVLEDTYIGDVDSETTCCENSSGKTAFEASILISTCTSAEESLQLDSLKDGQVSPKGDQVSREDLISSSSIKHHNDQKNMSRMKRDFLSFLEEANDMPESSKDTKKVAYISITTNDHMANTAKKDNVASKVERDKVISAPEHDGLAAIHESDGKTGKVSADDVKGVENALEGRTETLFDFFLAVRENATFS